MRICRLSIFVLVALIVCSASGFSQQDQIKKKKSQLHQLRKEINAFEKQIKDKEKKERATLDLLGTYDRQTMLLKKLVHDLQLEEQELQLAIDSTQHIIEVLNDKVAFLKRHYSNYAAAAYKHGETYDLELLLTSKSLNEAFIRSEYLKRFSRERKRDIDEITALREELEEQNDLLQRQLSEQQDLIEDKTDEEKNLQLKTKKRKVLLTQIRRDKKNVQKEINRRVEAAKEMEQLIAKLIEHERKKKELEERRRREGNVNTKPRESTGDAFEARRGQYRWPVGGGKIVARFGNQENPTLHTITQNTGIDIAVSSGTPVESIADGEVSTIWWLPSFGNLVIISHQGGYRTVYAHLSEILVNEGDNVFDGEQIGRTGEALSGPMFHFELWKDRDKQDPERWLRPRGLSQGK